MKPVRALIITYYWPPASSVGVRRWLRFAEQLPESGIQPVICHPKDPSYPLVDHDRDIRNKGKMDFLEVPIFEWRDLYMKLKPQKKSGQQVERNKIDSVYHLDKKRIDWIQRISLWVRANLTIPDARAAWIRPCSKAINDHIKHNPVDIIISTGPPHTCHVIADRVKKNHPQIPWIADFRDPWTGGAYFNLLPLSSFGFKRHKVMEKRVLQNADMVTTVSWTWAEQLKGLGANEVEVITNGIDERQFLSDQTPPEDKYILSHVGTLYKDRSAGMLWRSLSEYLSKNQGFRSRFELRLIGQIGEGVRQDLRDYGLDDVVNELGVLTHQQAIHEMQRSHALLLVVNYAQDHKGRIPAKVFEYVASRRPILLIGPEDGDIHKVLKGHYINISHEENDPRVYTDSLDKLFNDQVEAEVDISRFENKPLTDQLADLINRLVKER